MTNQTTIERVTIQINLDSRYGGCKREKSLISVAGRILASRHTPSSKVELGEGVTVIRGGFPPRGGTRREPALKWERRTVLEVEGVPADMAQEEAEETYGITIISPQHTARCAEDRAAVLRWRTDHPDYCRVCDGAGGTLTAGVRYYADGSGEPDLWDACEGCVAIGRCPWCRGRLKTSEAEGLYRCRQTLKCMWNEQDSDRAPLAAWQCVCWEDQIDEDAST